jgi:ATP-grasp in the biosynthetic pathway with Ter operon
MKILLLTYGNESSIEMVRSIAELNAHEVYGCHYDTVNPGQAYLNKKYVVECPNPFTVPTEFLVWFNDFVRYKAIDRVFVTNCKMLKFVYDNWEYIECKDHLATPNKAGLEPCLFKDKLYSLLPGISPRVFSDLSEAPAGVDLFVKPSHGSSAVGARKMKNSRSDWGTVTATDVVTEYLPGEEFTVDCVSTPAGELVDWNVRLRERIRDGITSHGRSAPEYWDLIGEHVKAIASKLRLPYFWFAQFKFDSTGTPKLIEVNCRISGSFCITKASRKDYIKLVASDFDESTIVKGPTAGKSSIARHMNVLPVGRRAWVWDIDGTICTETGGNYHLCVPIPGVIDLINEQHARGDEVVLHTARGMKRFNNDVAAVYQNLYELTKKQLDEWGVRYDKLIMGKPYGTPVDSDAVRVSDLKKTKETT